MTAPVAAAVLRRLVLACVVLHDVDALPDDAGVLVDGEPPLRLAWSDVADAVAAVAPDEVEGRPGRLAVLRLLRAARMAGDVAASGTATQTVRPVALPVTHTLHPGPGWVRRRVLGGVLDVGLGLLGASGDPDRVDVLPPALLARAGLDEKSAARAWSDAEDYLERMGELAASRRLVGSRPDVLRPMGDCDAVTLLASDTFRAALCGGGRPPLMRAVAMPTRDRGWLDARAIDPAFVAAAAAAVDEEQRGFPVPVLVTPDEVTYARRPGRDGTYSAIERASSAASRRATASTI